MAVVVEEVMVVGYEEVEATVVDESTILWGSPVLISPTHPQTKADNNKHNRILPIAKYFSAKDIILRMEITKVLHATNRKEWRAWLKRHHKTDKEIWLKYHRKETGKPRISYNDAVEEALCFGWIDSTVKKLDEKSFVQRFSPRNPKSPYSQMNRERLRKLIAQRKVIKLVLATLEGIFDDEFEAPPAILKAVKANKKAWENYQGFSDRYKRIRIAFIAGAKSRPTEYKKRLAYFIKMTEKGKQFGFGGIRGYF